MSAPSAGTDHQDVADTAVPDPPRRLTDRVVDAVGGSVSGVALGLASAWRHARSFHPRGRAFHATLEVHGDPRFAGTVLGHAAERDAVVRFSRGVGVAEPLPDMLGLALRVFDVDGADGFQDLLMLSSAPAVGVRNVILFRTDYGSVFYSSVDRLAVGDRTVVLGARPRLAGAPRSLARLDDLATAVAARQLRFELQAATPLGDWAPVATLVPGEEMAAAEGDELHFSPFHTAGGIEPVGAVNALRRLGYAGSQAGRPR